MTKPIEDDILGMAQVLTDPAVVERVQAAHALVDAICDKDESLSPRHTHSDVQGTVYGGLEGDY